MDWNEFLNKILTETSVLDEMRLQIASQSESVFVPSIIKASIQIIERIEANQCKNNIVVFPERTQTALIFTIVKTIYSISEGEMKKKYNPKSFVKGEKLKLGNSVVAFNGVDIDDGKTRIKINTADLEYSAPIEIVPLLQRSNTKRPLSKYKVFCKARNDAREQGKLVAAIADYRTYISSSIYYVSSIKSTKEQFRNCRINERQLNDLILFGHAKPNGVIRYPGAGQLTGTPAIVLSADLYSVLNAQSRGADIQSVIVDISNPNMIEAQLNAIDDIMRQKKPIIFLTDTINSYDLQLLLNRGFNLWRWDEECITSDLYGGSPYVFDTKTNNCANRNIEYKVMDCIEISETLKGLYNHRNEVREQSPGMNNIFGSLFGLTLSALRNLIPNAMKSYRNTNTLLDESERILAEERAFIEPEAFTDFMKAIDALRIIYSKEFSFGKVDALEKYLIDNPFDKVCIVVPEHTDIVICQKYWKKMRKSYDISAEIIVIHPSQHNTLPCPGFDVTIIAGWLDNKTMWRILHSYITEKYIVLLYDYELRWKNAHTSRWRHILSNESSRDIIREFFSISISRDQSIPQTYSKTDELEDIELILRENRYRKYLPHENQKDAGEVVEAVPVSFVGGYLGFFRTSHEIVKATDIILNEGDKISTIPPSSLEIGDFVIVRMADRDIIRDMADTLLSNSGKCSCRELSGKWREPLVVENLFSPLEEIYQKMKADGFSKDFVTFRHWMTDVDTIAPQDKEDIIHIAQVTEDVVLLELAEQVYEAARTVRAAHVQAGRYLSKLLKKRIASELRALGDIDPFNIWEPISLNLEEIGLVRILKVIDKGDVVHIDAGNTNRLMEEM